MNSEFQLYKACYVDNIKFYEIKYYDKKLYYIHVYVIVGGKIETLYFRQGYDIRELKRKAELYYKGEMKHFDVCRCFVQLEQKYFVRDLQTGIIRRDESGKFIQIDKYPICAGVYPVEDGYYDFMFGNVFYNFMHGNDPTSQSDNLKKRGILVLPVDGKLPSNGAPFNSRELSLDELLK